MAQRTAVERQLVLWEIGRSGHQTPRTSFRKMKKSKFLAALGMGILGRSTEEDERDPSAALGAGCPALHRLYG